MPASDGNSCNVELSGLSVVVAATSNNPTILNADFLKHNGIVLENHIVVENPPQVSTPAFSQVAFENGLIIRADPARILFEQFTDSLTIEDIVCADIAKRYIKTIPHVPYSAIGINVHGYGVQKKRVRKKVSDALVEKGKWMKIKTVTPEFQLKAIYKFDDKKVTLDIAENLTSQKDAERAPRIIFQANIHRDITETNQQMRINTLLSILDSWKGDLSDFHSLVENFNSKNNI